MAKPNDIVADEPTSGRPQPPTLPDAVRPERPTPPPFDPAAIGPDAIQTVAGRKFGWQQPRNPAPVPEDPDTCAHTALVGARAMLKADPDSYSVGDEWLCTCGQVFVVTIGDAGNKILKEKDEEV